MRRFELRQHRLAIVAGRDALQRQHRRCKLRGLGEGEAGDVVLDKAASIGGSFSSAFQSRLRLPGLAGLVAKPIDEGLHVVALGGDLHRQMRLLRGAPRCGCAQTRRSRPA